jgi:hypothetical protein
LEDNKIVKYTHLFSIHVYTYLSKEDISKADFFPSYKKQSPINLALNCFKEECMPWDNGQLKSASDLTLVCQDFGLSRFCLNKEGRKKGKNLEP